MHTYVHTHVAKLWLISLHLQVCTYVLTHTHTHTRTHTHTHTPYTQCVRTYSSPSCHPISPSHLTPFPHTSIPSLYTVHCTAQIAVITQTCTEDGAGCERDDLHPLTLSPPHPLTLLTLSLPLSTYHSPPYPPTPTPNPPTPLLTLPPYRYSLTLSSLSLSPQPVQYLSRHPPPH